LATFYLHYHENLKQLIGEMSQLISCIYTFWHSYKYTFGYEGLKIGLIYIDLWQKRKLCKYIFIFFQELLADAKKSQHDVKVGIISSWSGI
jgi:hypothetical protein